VQEQPSARTAPSARTQLWQTRSGTARTRVCAAQTTREIAQWGAPAQQSEKERCQYASISFSIGAYQCASKSGFVDGVCKYMCSEQHKTQRSVSERNMAGTRGTRRAAHSMLTETVTAIMLSQCMEPSIRLSRLQLRRHADGCVSRS
jgi:pyruvate/2-oxoglutarate dehydrogenase complex dihydrolipoamide dehydrogenase (E3) component